ncbi:uncharacterized protein LOC101744895 isoform X1 [Bombyx mori]|uniref:phospholipase A2 n=1 Tax=Bombyx mori TaxID=7091 RepID=A0A8R2C693_BOMMO|nr:uncharacterized protein LOC101744895 isoform X1 [Bombyx mori]
MELKTPKAKKKSNLAKLISWGRMFRTPLLILFLLGTTNCHDDSDIDVSEPSHLRHKHNHIQPNVNETIKNKLSDIKYLRRHLNKEIVNFVMTDYLVDGEIENRVHYNGITAKETYVGSDGRGLKLRQLTDGRHFVQVIYSQNGVVQDCEYVTRPKSARDFLKTLRRELKTALDEERFRIQHEDTDYSDDEKFLRHYRNVSFSLLMKNEALPREVANWLDYDQLKLQCLRRHEELRNILENQSQIPDNSIRSRRSIRENFILPGTKWCGAGQLASDYEELGDETAVDRCCRKHDNCQTNIGNFRRRFGYFNYRPYTISHCRCDRRPKREVLELLRVPGTKWCGKGFSATKYSQLGRYTRTDRCCRVHDLKCPFWIGGMERKYGVYNWRVNTLMHCRCDERFRACLKLADTPVSNMVGKLFFNVVQTKCFRLKPVKVCMQRSWWGKCLRRGYMKQAFLRDNLRY